MKKKSLKEIIDQELDEKEAEFFRKVLKEEKRLIDSSIAYENNAHKTILRILEEYKKC